MRLSVQCVCLHLVFCLTAQHVYVYICVYNSATCLYVGEGRTKWAPQPKWAPARLPLFTMVRVIFHYWC